MEFGEFFRVSENEVFPQDKYQVTFGGWTGPFDVLLQVIDEQGLNLLDLDIVVLLEHYLDYLQNLSHINLDEAGDFLVVAATLAQIKSKLLLPEEDPEEGEEEKDPREDLVRYLQEYQKFKQAAAMLRDRPVLGRDVFIKGAHELFEGLELQGQGNLFQLVKGFEKLMREIKTSEPLEITREELSVSFRLRQIFEHVAEKGRTAFRELFNAGVSKSSLIVSFLALLELVRLQKLVLSFHSGGEMYVEKVLGVVLTEMEISAWHKNQEEDVAESKTQKGENRES